MVVTPDSLPWVAWVVLAATVVAVVGLVLATFRREVAIGLAAAVIAGLAEPAAYAVTPLQSQVNGSNPTAGLSGGMGFSSGGGFRGMMRPGQNGQPSMTPSNGQDGQGQNGQDAQDGQYGRAQDRQGEQDADGRFGRMGGFTGSDPAMTVTCLKELMASGKLRYVLAGGDDRDGPGRGNGEVTTWVQASCKAVTG